MRTKPDSSASPSRCCLCSVAIALMLAAGAVPCGLSQQNQPIPSVPPQAEDESARLLKLATELKAEVDKSNKDTLSIAVIRKADEVERIAHGMKEKLRAAVPADSSTH